MTNMNATSTVNGVISTHAEPVVGDAQRGRQSFAERIIRIGAVGIAAATIGLSALFGVGTPSADAAGLTTKPDIHSCFVWTHGGVYANQPVFLRYLNANNQWQTNRAGTTNSNGCVRWEDLGVGYHYQILAFVSLSGPSQNCRYEYAGATYSVRTVSGDALNRLGTFQVPFYRTVGC